jgi:TPR repeat protein
MPDGKTVNKVQTGYRCPLTIAEALTWLETNSGPGEVGEKMEEGLELLEKEAPQILEKAVESLPDLYQKIESGIESNNKKIEFLKKNAQSGEGKALAGLGILKLMSTIMPTGVENDPEGGLSMLKVAAEKQAVPAYVMLATVNMLAMANLIQDFGTAAGWIEKAVVEQRSDARNALGMLKLFGLGVEQDGEEAVQLLTLSAQQGNASAHFNLGIIHVFYPENLMQKLGISLDQNLTKGMMHLKIASEIASSLDQLHENAVQVWNYLSRHKHPELLEPSRDLSRKWKKEHQRKVNKSNTLLKIQRRKYPDVTLQMYFKIEGGQVKLLDSYINSKLEWSLF